LALLQSGVPSERQDQADVVVVGGVEEKHTEGRYFLNSNKRSGSRVRKGFVTIATIIWREDGPLT